MARCAWLTVLVTVGWVTPGSACSICLLNLQAATLRQDVAQSKLVLHGTLTRSDFAGKTTEMTLLGVLKSDPWLGGRKVVTLPRYYPVDPQKPPEFVVLCDVFRDKLDPFRGLEVKGPGLTEYLRGLAALDDKDPGRVLLYCFAYLEHREAEVATDAFLEFAKAPDQVVGEVAGKLDAGKLRAWVLDPKTPGERLGLYGFLLGACGDARDAAVLRSQLDAVTPRTASALSGLLSGYIQLRPHEGWDALLDVLRNPRRSFTERHAALAALRFYHGWKPQESHRDILRGLAMALTDPELAGLAVEDLRQWTCWDLTGEVLALYARKDFNTPLMRRCLLRYALSCPLAEAARFTADQRQRDPELVREVELYLQSEKRK